MTEGDEGEARDALRRSLGLRPRTTGSSSESAAAGRSDESSPGQASSAQAPAAVAVPTRARDLGLGVRRRSQSTAGGAVPPPSAEPVTDPLKKPVGRLGTDSARLLRQDHMLRPEIDLPAFVMDLPGTHGWYMGDGSDNREIVVGFTPAFVLYTLPLYPDGPPEWVKGEFLMPSLPAQPEYTERGFKVPAHLNQVNSMCHYLIWQSPTPLAATASAATTATGSAAAPDDESPRDRRRREEMEKRKRDLEARKARNEAQRRR